MTSLSLCIRLMLCSLFLQNLTTDIQCVEHILRVSLKTNLTFVLHAPLYFHLFILKEMTGSWPPLLSGIDSPSAQKVQSLVQVTVCKHSLLCCF